MGSALIATSALALSAGPASAADMMSVGVGGYMEQWVGYANRDDKGVDGGIDIQSDSEIYFQGSMESDQGLKFGVHVQLEANNGSSGATNIDESFAWISGDFGRIEIGQRDPIHARTHYAIKDVGVGLQAGDTQKWIPGQYLQTAGWHHDNLNVIYLTPRMNGVQVGVSYGADADSENSVTIAPEDNDDAVWAAGINFNEKIGDMSFKVSLGHMNRAQSAAAVDPYNHDNADESAEGATAKMMKGRDDHTFTNAGLQIGMGAFSFAVSYATRDQGRYMLECLGTVGDDANTVIPCTDPAETTGIRPASDHDGDGTADITITGVRAAEDDAGKSDTWGASIAWSDGPMSVSLGHMVEEFDDSTERVATMLSAAYKLAPGVSWATSIFGVEDDTAAAASKNPMAMMTEGTAFVTGIKIGF